MSAVRSLRDRARFVAESGPGLKKADPSTFRQRCTRRAMARLALFCEGVAEPNEELARILECDESAVRRAKAAGLGLPLPWWLEALVEKRPDLAARYVETLLEDIERAAISRGEKP